MERETDPCGTGAQIMPFPECYPPRPPCPNKADHTPSPRDWREWQDWNRRMRETHNLEACVGCGLYLIWVVK